tara:strand:+ start:401 stop:562 length:162 start_codon:yes stop_codon:yes gene_type:complete
MCLIKKHKKYQYLYLKEKLISRDYEADKFNIKDYRGIFYEYWLKKINKKYNYD